MFFPLYLITKIQRRNFKVARSLKDIKSALKLTDKGRVIEELFATPAWLPIISLESANGPQWEEVRKNFLEFVNYLPSTEKLGEIAKMEVDKLINEKILIDSKQISMSTVKIFLMWLFCENEEKLKNNSENQESNENKIGLNENSFNFINQFLSKENLNMLFESGIEYRKEIAIKGKGCPIKKRQSVEFIVSILKQSKFSNLFAWEKPEFYSTVMQPFIISPMINISDIAVSIKKYIDKYENKNFGDFIDNCIFNDHPFPMLERYDEKSNTQIFISLIEIKNNPELDGKTINFGMGIRSCLGRLYAKSFMANFFLPMVENQNLFEPLKNHLFSGRDNDHTNFKESLYQIKVLVKILLSEMKRSLLGY